MKETTTTARATQRSGCNEQRTTTVTRCVSLRIRAFPSVRRFVVKKFPAILCRGNSTHVTEDLRKMLLAFEAAGHGYIQYSLIGRAQHLLCTLEPPTQEKLVRGFAG